MYNRYIPPPKPKAAQPPQRPPPRAYVPEPAPAPPPSPPPAPVQAQTSSWLQPYARRVDPATLKEPSRIVFGDDDADLAPPVASKTEETTESKKEVKVKEPKQKKRKREERDQEKLSANPETPLGEQREPSEKQEGTTEDASEQKKKPKREKKKKAAPHETQDDDTSVRTRHKAVFENMEKALEKAQEDAMDIDKAEEEQEEEPVVEHGLEPLPQPAPVIFDESKLTYETLPPWLANPIRVSDSTRKSFEELGISPEAARVLETKDFKEAFAVQTAVLPLLLPQPDRQGDVVVAAPTGSGKTLSYVLPMIEDISKSKITRLRGIIVLPTRDLVQQVQLACEACAAAFAVHGGKRVKIATAMGHKVFKEEQAAIMAEEQSYDPEGYEKWKKKTTTLVNLEDSDSDDDHHNLDLNPTKPLPNHVVNHVSKVDVLICTPGRLVEHITKTRGFSLDYARWLVVDEADKLLAQDFQQWLDVVLQKLSIEKPHARAFPRSNKSGVRKVILSATMTRDLSLLNGLKLSRPRLVLLEGTKAGQQSLPPLLKESAIKIRDPSLKPLYLIDLLNSEHITAINKTLHATESVASQTSDSDSSSDSNSDDESGSESESESESEVDSDSDSSSNSDSSSESEYETPKKKTAKLKKLDTTVLIFTKSNEATLRLSRLLCLLAPELGPLIGTLTSSTKTIRRTRTLRFFAEGKLRILVASDLVSRGIDLENLEHVINYDLPISETSYVHRVGRTARAGRAGHAWTLLEHSEARRFWRDFAGEGKGASTNILRSGQVERVRITGAARGSEDEKAPEFSEERMKAYEKALEQLKREATGHGEGRRVDVAMRGKQQ